MLGKIRWMVFLPHREAKIELGYPSISIMIREAGKGSKQRPTDHTKFSDGWDRIFKKEAWCYYSDLPSVDSYCEEEKSDEDERKDA